ncbi:site-specific integrase [Candidatus Bathyarchaeota archaeon]|nr:site-specific integrase [Candidatus Bathyarchaeota archaeon]
MPRKGQNKYASLLEDPDVDRWLSNLARGSPTTARVALRRLGKACELLSTDPREMLEASRTDLKQFQDSLEDLVERLESEEKAPQYIRGFLKTIRSWLRYNDITLTRRIKISRPSATPTIENEQVPSKGELSRILRTSPLRIKVAVALMAFADLRPGAIGNIDGSDGLKLGDLPELKIENGEIAFEKIPAMVVVRSSLSKIKRRYFTFLSSEGCTYLKEYLEERVRKGGKLTAESPVIGHEKPRDAVTTFVSSRKVSEYIRRCMRKAGVRKRPYVLRAYAETQLIIAESKGKISHPYLQFIAGHKGDIESRYSTNKGRLLPDMIEDMRENYKQCEPFLSTTNQLLEQNAVVKEAQKEALKSIAKNVLGIDLIDVKIAKEKELGRELEPEEEIELLENEIKKMREQSADPQMIVREDQLKDYLTDGWEFVSVLPSKKILIRK